MSNIFARQKNYFLLIKGSSRTNFPYRALSEDFSFHLLMQATKKLTVPPSTKINASYLLFSSEQNMMQPLFTVTLGDSLPDHTLRFPSAGKPTCLPLRLCPAIFWHCTYAATEVCSAWKIDEWGTPWGWLHRYGSYFIKYMYLIN